MSDSLKEIINTLSEGDRYRFRTFIQREKPLRSRKDLALFEDLAAGKTISGDKKGTGPYHAVRRRLTDKLVQFISLRQQEEDATGGAGISGFITFARYLFDHNEERLAWRYLEKAEKKAEQNEQYVLLHRIYSLMVDHSASDHAPDLREVVRKRGANKVRMDEDERASIAAGLVLQELKRGRQQGGAPDIDRTIDQVLKEYQLEDTVLKRPRLMYNILSITRGQLLAKKEHHAFAPYAVRTYREALSQEGFSRHNHYYKLGFLYMVAHALYRNRDFAEAMEYADQLGENMKSYDRAHYRQFYSRHVLLTAALHCYMGNLRESIGMLALALEEGLLPLKEALNARLNLAIYYFLDGQVRLAIRTSAQTGLTDHRLEKLQGKEWVFKKNLMEAIALLEAGDEDIAEGRIRAVERKYSQMLKRPVYARVGIYIQFIKKLLRAVPDARERERFFQSMQESLVIMPEEEEDLQAMAFYAWMKARVNGRDFYGTLLETVEKL